MKKGFNPQTKLFIKFAVSAIALFILFVAIFEVALGAMYSDIRSNLPIIITAFIAFWFATGCVLVYLYRTTVQILRKAHTVFVKYHVDDLERLAYIGGKSDWVDLRVAKDYEIHEGDYTMLDLGISVKLPEGYEMIIAPRSSTFKNYGLIQTNSIGVIDESYSSDDDVLMWPCYATRDTKVKKGDRLCQFRILKHQPVLCFDEVPTLGTDARGGFGSTGKN